MSLSWNSMFHEICKLCDLEHEFPPWVMPSCYTKKKICGHILKVNLDKATTDTLYLSALDNMSDTNSNQLPISVATLFIQSVVYENQFWDIGLQHKIIDTNPEKIFNAELCKVEQYTSKYICPCGTPFKKLHVQNNITKLPKFRSCDTLFFKDHIDFISHLYGKGCKVSTEVHSV